MSFLEIINQFWLPFLFSGILSLVLILICLKLFPRLNLMDKPWKYGLKRDPIPYFGGLSLYFVVVISIILFVPLTLSVFGFLLGATIICIIGFLDDYFDISPFIRLFFQFVACIVLVFCGIGILSVNIPFFGVLSFTEIEFEMFSRTVFLLGALFTVVWVMLIVNSMNLLDGVSGLTSGISCIAAFTLFFLSIHSGIHENPASQIGVATIALILAVSCAVFAFFDFPKPKILMGDTGSTFLGFTLATLAIFSGGKIATAFLVLGIPLLDMAWVVLRRVFVEKKPFWRGDLKHLHHRLLNLGFSKRKVLLFYYFVTAFLGVLAIVFVSANQKFFILLGLLFAMLLLVLSFVFFAGRKN